MTARARPLLDVAIEAVLQQMDDGELDELREAYAVQLRMVALEQDRRRDLRAAARVGELQQFDGAVAGRLEFSTCPECGERRIVGIACVCGA